MTKTQRLLPFGGWKLAIIWNLGFEIWNFIKELQRKAIISSYRIVVLLSPEESRGLDGHYDRHGGKEGEIG